MGVDSDPVCNDFRYEDFIKKPSRKYMKEDIDGRATLVRSRENPEEYIFIVNGHEVECDIGHFLASGTKIDISFPKGKDVMWKRVRDKAQEQGALLFIVHPFSIWGAGHFFEKNQEYLENFQAIEIINANAYFPLPGYRKANEKAIDFFVRMHKNFPKLGGVVFQDHHKIYEIGRNCTKMLGRLDPNNFMSSLLEGIASCTPDRINEHRYNATWGLIGGSHHLFDNLIYEGMKLFRRS